MEVNLWTMIIFIVLIGAVTSTIQAYINRNKPGEVRRRRHLSQDSAEVSQLTDEVRVLRERIVVLERIATDRPHALEHEIERLRDR